MSFPPARPLLAGILILTIPGLAAAQRPADAALARVAALRPAELAEPRGRPAVEPAGTYQTEGALIGGLALGLPTLLFLSGLCETDDCASDVHLGALGMTAIGAFLGAVIGGAIERSPDTTPGEAP